MAKADPDVQLRTPGQADAFRLGEPRYDQSTYWGRLCHFLDIVDPRTLLVSDAKLKSSVNLLSEYKEGRLPPNVSNSELWEAQKIKQAIIHPDTGKKILMPFRMSGYVPFGTVTVVGLLLPNPSMASVALWQTLNQAHNAGVNFSNRNASTPVSNTTLAISSLAATGTASTVALSMHAVLKSPVYKQYFKHQRVLSGLIPFISVAVANQINVLCMRASELTNGVDVYEEGGRVVGQSQICGQRAVLLTMLTRFILPAPILILPWIIMSQMERSALWKRFPAIRFPFHVAVCMAAFGVALPVTIAIFPQTLQVRTSKLETEIKLATRQHVLYYSRGM